MSHANMKKAILVHEQAMRFPTITTIIAGSCSLVITS